MSDDTNNVCGVTYEGSHYGLFECGHFFDPTNQESFKTAERLLEAGRELGLKTPFIGSRHPETNGVLCTHGEAEDLLSSNAAHASHAVTQC